MGLGVFAQPGALSGMAKKLTKLNLDVWSDSRVCPKRRPRPQNKQWSPFDFPWSSAQTTPSPTQARLCHSAAGPVSRSLLKDLENFLLSGDVFKFSFYFTIRTIQEGALHNPPPLQPLSTSVLLPFLPSLRFPSGWGLWRGIPSHPSSLRARFGRKHRCPLRSVSTSSALRWVFCPICQEFYQGPQTPPSNPPPPPKKKTQKPPPPTPPPSPQTHAFASATKNPGAALRTSAGTRRSWPPLSSGVAPWRTCSARCCGTGSRCCARRREGRRGEAAGRGGGGIWGEGRRRNIVKQTCIALLQPFFLK